MQEMSDKLRRQNGRKTMRTETKTVKHPEREHRTMRTIKTMAAVSVLILAFYVTLSAGTASAKTLEGTGYGNDLLVGGKGEDTVDGGPGSDQINAQDGQKDTIVIRPGEYDTVYYDKGLDVLQEQGASRGTPDGSADLTASGTDNVELVAKRPPEGLFGHTGKVLVEHRGEELLLSEEELKGHLEHGDEIIDPTGRAEAEQGRG